MMLTIRYGVLRAAIVALAFGGVLNNPVLGWSADNRWLAPADTPAATPAAGKIAVAGYDLRGIFDPGFHNILACAMKVPQGWRLAQSFTREWRGTIPINKVYTGLSSPDGSDSIEFLPCMMYHYEDGDSARRLRQFSEQRGMRDPTSLPPMSPVEYLKKVYLPMLAAQAGFAPRLTEAQDLPPQQINPGTRVARGFVRGTLPSGAKVYLDVQITTLANRVMDAMVYSMEIHPRLVQSNTDLEATLACANVIDRTVVFNPDWQRQDAELTRRGADEAIRSTMEQWRINRDAAEARRQAINRHYENHRRASDRVNNAFCDYLGDRVLYENPDTGQRVKVQNGGRHAYQDNGGNVLTTDAPLDPNNVDWRELQEVEVKNY